MAARPRLRVMVLFAVLAVGSIAATTLGLVVGLRRLDHPEAVSAIVSAGLVAGFGILLVTALAWLFFDEHMARAVDRMATALRARAHSGVKIRLDARTVRHLGDLAPAAVALCDRLAAEQEEGAARVAKATAALEAEKQHLSAILSEIPIAVMVVDANHRIKLYDRQCVHALGHVANLGLGRSVFRYLDREALTDTLEALRASEGAHSANAELPTSDGSGSVRARLRVIDRGYVLAMEVDEDVLAERPLVFDFELMHHGEADDIADRPLAALTYVVFDTETTGLAPDRDAIVQIGAVRAVNRRLVDGETFETFVDPGRPIPPVASRVHGITDEMVAGAPDIRAATRAFHDFAHDAVLVAHNAPFDLGFLRRCEAQAGVRFDHPVLDTVLLSAALFGKTELHTLDAIAERLGVHIDGAVRHTAIGDAVATASVLLRMLPILEARGIRTFGEAVAVMRRYERLLPDLHRA